MIDNAIDVRETAVTRARYQRLAPMYDRMEAMSERRFHPWRQRLWSLVHGPRVLEVGVGTGKNMDVLNPLVVRVMSANINRRTEENVQRSGWTIEHVEDLGLGGIVKLIIARP